MSQIAMERPVVFDCQGEELLGMLHPAENAAPQHGVLLIVGGPQYRVGSHRQFVLLARALAQAGVPVLRFDYRGMGDSSGRLRDFGEVEADIRAALDVFHAEFPTVQQVTLWGLCDAASAACFYAPTDRRVAGLVLLNPWVRTEQGEARAVLKHYYWRRLASRDFWRKLFSGGLSLAKSLRDLRDVRRKAGASAQSTGQDMELPERMLHGLQQFRGRVLLVLSGHDLVAQEFQDLVDREPRWNAVLTGGRVTTRAMPDADHTFSLAVHSEAVARLTIDWQSQAENAVAGLGSPDVRVSR